MPVQLTQPPRFNLDQRRRDRPRNREVGRVGDPHPPATSIDNDLITTGEAQNAGAQAFVNKADLPSAPLARMLGGE
jgi:hypothetical protein